MNRRSLLTGLIGVLAAPAVVRAEGLMKIAAPRVIPYRSPPSASLKLLCEIERDRIIAANNHVVLRQMIDSMLLSSKPQSPWQPQKLQFSASIDHTNWSAIA